MKYKQPAISIAAGRVKIHARAMARTVLHCNPESDATAAYTFGSFSSRVLSAEPIVFRGALRTNLRRALGMSAENRLRLPCHQRQGHVRDVSSPAVAAAVSE